MDNIIGVVSFGDRIQIESLIMKEKENAIFVSLQRLKIYVNNVFLSGPRTQVGATFAKHAYEYDYRIYIDFKTPIFSQ